jgi:uncharacterized damage-inducible protein DinB
MSSSALRPGRPRRYDIQPPPGFPSPAAGYAFAALNELSDRLFDLISDLPQGALDYVPEGTTNSIAMLAIHMIWAEAGWVSRVTQTALPTDLTQSLQPGRQDASGELPAWSAPAAHLIELCDRVRREVTEPALAALDDVDVEIPDEHRPMTARGVLMHLVWHWTYHSGQVGLLRRLWGAGYRWTFDRRIGAPRQD